jgi:hypothetical protein
LSDGRLPFSHLEVLMNARKIFNFHITEADRDMIHRLAKRLERSSADAVRYVLRQEARRLGVLPDESNPTPPAQNHLKKAKA